jgi:hypothetical protein
MIIIQQPPEGGGAMLITEIDNRDLLSEMSAAGRGVSIYGEGEPPSSTLTQRLDLFVLPCPSLQKCLLTVK